MRSAGIDVAARSFVLVIDGPKGPGKAKTYANDATGFGAAIQALRAGKVARVCLEATGAYHLDLTLALEAAGLGVMVVNPHAAKRFAEALVTRNKTDAVDAAVLAQFAARMPFVPWQRPPQQALELRAVARRIATLTAQRTQAKNQHHALRQSHTTPAVVLADVELSITQLDGQIERLRDWALALIAQHADLQQPFALLTSVKGIAAASAIALLGELLVLPPEMRAKQWVALAGLDPRQHTSGHSVKKRARLSKAGNRRLRQALFMPALSATRHEPQVKAYYQHLIETRGLKKIQAVCAVMRKLLHAIHGMLASQQPFDGSRFYASQPAAA
jgi:transposase